MSTVRDGIAASPGIVIGIARVLRWEAPAVPHAGGIAGDEVEAEVLRFQESCAWAQQRIRELQERTRERMGEVEAQIFEPQILMLEDADLIGGTIALIRDNLLHAERAFEWKVLEWEGRWAHTSHPMVLDKLNDLADIHTRVLRRLMALPEPDADAAVAGGRTILVARDLTASLTAQLDPAQIVGIATDAGTRTSHSAILSRSLHIPSVVSLGNLSEQVRTGDVLILDGRAGRVIINPSEAEQEAYRDRDFHIREWEQELLLLAHLDAVTRDNIRIALRANIDLPGEAANAVAHGAEGVGLFRTEFLVVGRNAIPGEEEQYRAYRAVSEAFGDAPVVIRTYDLGGDKFPAFLHMPPEENPFLGWRAIRVCLDEPTMFRPQLRALLRASVHGDIRIMLPLVNETSDLIETRALLDSCLAELRDEGVPTPDSYTLGAMIETPAAAMLAPELARHADFFSIGTNDLVQYALAVDRGNSRLARLYNPFHPAVLRLLDTTIRAGRAANLEVSVCGEFAANPLGAFLLIGLGAHSLSVGPAALAEIKKIIRSVTRAAAERAAQLALQAAAPAEVEKVLSDALAEMVDLSLFTGGPRLSE